MSVVGLCEAFYDGQQPTGGAGDRRDSAPEGLDEPPRGAPPGWSPTRWRPRRRPGLAERYRTATVAELPLLGSAERVSDDEAQLVIPWHGVSGTWPSQR